MFWRRAQILLALTLLGVIVFRTGPARLIYTFSNARGSLVLACVLSIAASYYFRSLTFALIARPYARLSIGPVFLFTLIGAFFSNVLPGQVGGDIVKGAYLIRYFQSGTRAFAAIALHRAIGFAGTLLAGGIVALVLSLHGRPGLLQPAILLLAGGAALVAIPCFGSVLLRIFRLALPANRFSATRPAALARKFADALEGYSEHAGLVVASAILSALLSMQGAFSLMLAAWAVGLDQTAYEGLAAGLFAQLSAFLPLTPGGAGVTEHAYVAASSYLGFPTAPAAAAALLFRLCMLLVSLGGGFLYMRVPLPPVNAVEPGSSPLGLNRRQQTATPARDE